jgi:2-polyprenyl-6-methoxyphenol hydroxylase-like FAD-dependent oxidoreductase
MTKPGPQRSRVLIVGGGIGGLTSAIALARNGMNATLLERSVFADETGAGIQLGPNATRALAGLGVLDARLAAWLRSATARPILLFTAQTCTRRCWQPAEGLAQSTSKTVSR